METAEGVGEQTGLSEVDTAKFLIQNSPALLGHVIWHYPIPPATTPLPPCVTPSGWLGARG